MSKRSKACDIPQKVKDKVWERDDHKCVLCDNPNAMPNAHYIRRAQGGLGIEENVVTLCLKCHDEYDNGNMRAAHGYRIQWYLKSIYGDNWNEKNLIYKKY